MHSFNTLLIGASALLLSSFVSAAPYNTFTSHSSKSFSATPTVFSSYYPTAASSGWYPVGTGSTGNYTYHGTGTGTGFHSTGLPTATPSHFGGKESGGKSSVKHEKEKPSASVKHEKEKPSASAEPGYHKHGY